jgi:trk system potassium uptake protein
MKIVIVGLSTVGLQLLKRLSSENHNITVIDDSDRLKETMEEYGVQIISGNALSISTLSKVKLKTEDVVIAVTDSDSTNIMICHLASRLGVSTTLARVRNREIFSDFSILSPSDMGISKVIFPEVLAARQILNMIRRPFAQQCLPFFDKKVEILELIVGKTQRLEGLDLIALRKRSQHSFLVVAISRDGNVEIPFDASEQIRLGDRLFVVLKTEDVSAVARDLGYENIEVERVFLYGGTNIAVEIAKSLENSSIKIKIIEPDRNKAKDLAKDLHHVIVLHGEATDKILLESEGIHQANFFLAVTQDENKNILSSLLAKKIGAQKTVALVINPDYVQLESQLNIDALVSQRWITINKLLKFMRQGNVQDITELIEKKIMALEYKVNSNCVLLNSSLSSLEWKNALDEKVLIASVKRESQIFIPDGDYSFQVEDEVLVICPVGHETVLSKIFPS